MQFSGRTSCYEHKHGESWKKTPGKGEEALVSQKVFNAQWTNCPVEIEEIVKHLWKEWEFGNDHYYREVSPWFLRVAGPEGDGIILGEKWVWGSSKEEQKGWVPVKIDVKLFADYLVSLGVGETEKILVHWWW